MPVDDFGERSVDRLLQQLAAEARRAAAGSSPDDAAVPNKRSPGSSDQPLSVGSEAASEERQVDADDESADGRIDAEPDIETVAVSVDVASSEKIESWERLVAQTELASPDENSAIPGTTPMTRPVGPATVVQTRRSLSRDVWFGMAFVVIGLGAIVFGLLYL